MPVATEPPTTGLVVPEDSVYTPLIGAVGAMEVPVLSKGHKVLSNEYCYGYTDKFGKWNNGFQCPAQSSGEPVYCCGTATEPYCCRKEEEEPPAPAHDQTLLLGVALGTLLVVALLALGACLLCRRRMAHKNRHQTINGGPIYRMHCGSSSANTYSFSGHDSGATTPGTMPSSGVTGGGGAPVAPSSCHQHTASDRGALSEPFGEMEPPPPPPRDISSFSGLLTPCPCGLHYNGPMPHMEPPPPYQVESPHSTLLVRTIPSDASNCSQQSFGTLRISQQRPAQRFQQLPRLPQQQATTGRDPAYWCTKF
ncbi:protein shisa-3-like isoform X2 [Dermacentor albipictus]|uniref:protein shisa-3-like isoform X2 n=1 Tax=Dermacentor albipictus TaxID=60249 RepID=UPI0031FBD3A9